MEPVGRAIPLSVVLLLAGCLAGSLSGSVETLAKLDGWRDGPGYEGPRRPETELNSH